MNFSRFHNKKVAIKSYIFPSGLYYLALSLAKYLLSVGADVRVYPKESYNKVNGTYQKTIRFEPDTDDDLSHNYSDDQIIKSQPDFIISLETLLINFKWIERAKNKNIKVIDIPMIEWVEKNKIDLYSIFDEVWALNDLASQHIKIAEHYSWDYTFGLPDITCDKELAFLHLGSTSAFSNKNTALVITAFEKLKIPDKKLYVVGASGNKENIVYLSQLNRKKILSLYAKTSGLLFPSKREGLGLPLYEAKKYGQFILGTDAKPIAEASDIKCKVDSYSADSRLTQLANITENDLIEAMELLYEKCKSRC